MAAFVVVSGWLCEALSAGGGEVPSILPLGPYLDVWHGLALFPLLNRG